MNRSSSSVQMIRMQPLIPLVFAGLALVALLYSISGQIKKTLINERVVLKVGELSESTRFELKPDRRYTLELQQIYGGGQMHSWASLLVTMVHEESEEDIFELEDNYWAESGHWSEGGESGTWSEQNSKTKFNFRVTEGGEYRLESMLTEQLSRPHVELHLRISERKPVRLHWIPLLIGLLLLGGLAVRTAQRRQGTMCKYVEKLTAGSTLSIRGKLYSVQDVRVHHAPGEPTGFEWRLRAEDGTERYLAVETFEYYTKFSEDESQGRYLMIDVPDAQIDLSVDRRPAQQVQTVRVGSEMFGFDPDNSGAGSVTTYYEGEEYVSRYNARIFRASTFPAPSANGARIVEFVEFMGSPEEEWCVMEILSWRDIESVHFSDSARV